MTILVLAGWVRRAVLLVFHRGILFVLAPLCSLASGSVTLAWDASSGTNAIAGYKIYYGTQSRTYADALWAGTATTLTISNLVGGRTYYFAATAVDAAGLESDYSAEVSAIIAVGAASQPPKTVVTAPGTYLQFPIGNPLATKGPVAFSLDSSGPVSAQVNPTTGLFSWNVTDADALTTNYFTVRITDMNSRSRQGVQQVVVIVQDVFRVGLGAAAVQAGQVVSLPVTVTGAGGVADVMFTVEWPQEHLTAPTLVVSAPEVESGTIESRSTHLLVHVWTLPGQVISGSAQIAQLYFQAVAGQPSVFVPLRLSSIVATSASGVPYLDGAPGNGEVVVVGDGPLLRSARPSGSSQSLTLYGKVGLSYELQYTTNGFSANGWQPLLSYLQTNVAQQVVVKLSSPMVLYRLVAH